MSRVTSDTAEGARGVVDGTRGGHMSTRTFKPDELVLFNAGAAGAGLWRATVLGPSRGGVSQPGCLWIRLVSTDKAVFVHTGYLVHVTDEVEP